MARRIAALVSPEARARQREIAKAMLGYAEGFSLTSMSPAARRERLDAMDDAELVEEAKRLLAKGPPEIAPGARMALVVLGP